VWHFNEISVQKNEKHLNDEWMETKIHD
jgi:hypothetical protein